MERDSQPSSGSQCSDQPQSPAKMFQEKFQRYVRHTAPVLCWWIAARQDGLPVTTCTKAHQSRRRPRGRRRTPACGGGAARTTMTTVSMHLLLMLLLCVSRDSTAGTVSAYSLSPDTQLQAPRFTTQPSSSGSIVNEGRTKILQCHALGFPQPTYRWLKNGVPVGNFSSSQYLKILNITRDDAGSYQCEASNKAGTIFSEKIDVVVAYMGVFVDQSESIISVASGYPAILNLSFIESVPSPSVTWQTDEGPLEYNIKYAQTSSNQLIILSADEGDIRAYRARAFNTQIGREESTGFVRLNVTGNPYTEIAPEIIVHPQNTKVVRGAQTVELECIANARPLHELETIWLKDGIPIENTGIHYTQTDPWNRTVTLLHVNLTHTGEYTCQVQMRTGGHPIVFSMAQVTVQEPPTFVTPLRTETLGEYGSRTVLACDVIGEPLPKITWFKNAWPIEQVAGRYTVQDDNSLEIYKLGMDDTAMFQCLATNEAGEKSAYTWLKVKTSIPFMEIPPVNQTILDGKDATMNCRAIAAPTPSIQWIFNDTYPIETSSRMQILDSGDLLISNVRETDGGLYTCIRENEAGRVIGSGYLTVLVRTQINRPPADTTVLLGHSAALECGVSSDPTVPYNIDWYREPNRLPIKNSQRIGVKKDGTLEITEVRPSDVGQYSCIVTSPGGNETRSARLSVIELPFAPSNVQAVRLTTPQNRAINVSWTPGFDGNSKIIKFIIQRREVPELGPLPDPLLNWVTEVANVSAQAKWMLLTNLKAATAYQFRISSVNRVGEGSPSDPSNVVKLPQEAPSGPPVGFVGSARSSTEIIIQWQPPLEEHRNGQIHGYIIRYRLFGYNESPWNYRNITNEAQRNYLIQELITWKDYVIEIAAYNNMGVGVYTDGAKIKTKEGVPEAPPTGVRVQAINSTAIRIWWTPPNPQQINGINQGYKLQAWRYEKPPTLGAGGGGAIASGAGDDGNELIETEMKVLTVPPNLLDPLAEQSEVLSGLEKYTAYNITVLCFTDPGDGERSVPVPVQTLEDVPDEVSSLQFSGVSDREVTVTWDPPRRTNGVLLGYQIRYYVKDLPETARFVNLTATQSRFKVTHLTATTHYTFEVSGWTVVGAGPPKVATIQSGIEPVLPHPPYQLALSNIEAFSVVIQFTPGFDGNSSITSWVVEAQTARNLTWFVVHELQDPDASTVTVLGLTPFTTYRLRIIACNVVGRSEPSEATKDFQTIQARPKHPPFNVTVRAMSATELRVRWIPLQQTEWYGNPRGYNITYRNIHESETFGSAESIATSLEDSEKSIWSSGRSVMIEDPTANSHVLDGLEEWSVYEIAMTAVNEVGESIDSPHAFERTREAVPSMGPAGVEANATSSTTIVVRWTEVPKVHRNGQIEGYRVYYGSVAGRTPVLHKTIANNYTFTTTLTELKKFTQYDIQVLAYTRLGDGALSTPPVRIQTFEDSPGAPSNVSFPDVSFSMARIIWDVPEEPNGEILAYRVTYLLNGSQNLNFTQEFPPSDRTFRATQLLAERYYLFSVTAQTRLGWGKTAAALVYTTNNRQIPQAPSAPQISRSQVQSEQITFSWTPGRDGFAPLRYYSVQLRENEGSWMLIPERVDPDVTSYTATRLKPHTYYQFRIQATNDLGPSSYSRESVQIRTLPAAPSEGITGLKVVPITTTSVRVQWVALRPSAWNGDAETGGYRILYQPLSDFPSTLQSTPKMDVLGVNQVSAVLVDLTQDRNYEIILQPFNSQGSGPPSSPVAVYVGEAVPIGEPLDIEGKAISSTEVSLRWNPPQQNTQNGELLGYKIFYLVTDSSTQDLDPVPAAVAGGINNGSVVRRNKPPEEEIEVVPASYNTHNLVFLDKYTEYRIQILAFNPAGDGPRSAPITVKTMAGLPGPPTQLHFSDITMNSLTVSWDLPRKRNGLIVGYIVAYETTEDNEKFSKQVKQKVTGTSLIVQNLEEEVTYTFTVRAQTIDYGPAISGNVTTGPQEGSPGSPRDLMISKSQASVQMHWINGQSGKGPILGYYIESKKRDDLRWETVARSTNGPIQEFTVSFQNLLPSTAYKFRVISYNRYGISCPVYSDDAVLTPSKLYLEYGYLQLKPFYRQTWFMVALAATSIVIVIMVIAAESLQCRLCLHTADLLISIFGKRAREAEMCQKLREHLKLTVTEDETLPKHICLKCWDTVEYIDSFVRRVERNQSVLVYGERGEITFIVSVAEPPVEIDETYDFRKDSADPPSYDEAQKTKQATAMYDEGEGEELIEIIEAPCEDTVSEEENLVYDLLPLDDDSDERTTAERDELREEKDPIGDGATTIVCTTDEEAGILVRVNDYDFPPMIKDGRMIVHGEELEKCLAAYYGLACELCHQRNWATIGELFAHHRAAHDREGFVNCCGRTIEKKSQMAMHMAKHVQPEAFECPICKKMMTTPRILKAHMQNHLPEEERPLKCDLCPRRFSYVSALLIHASTHREENEGKCAYHLCHSCGRAFRSGDKLAEHIALSHRTDGTSNCVMCDTCGKKFISKSNLNYHLTTHQPKVLHQVQCEHCGKWLKNKLCLRKHMLQHSQVRHACDQCDYTTINVQSLQNHRRVQHTDEKPFVCPTCGKSFKVKSNLREHLAQHRQGQKYSCEFCSRKFTSKSNYYCHRKRMHPNELELERRKKEQEESAHRIRLKLKLQRQ